MVSPFSRVLALAIRSTICLMSVNDPTSRVCVCEPRVGGLDGGQTLAVAAVFPNVGDVDSIVVQVGDADADSFRLTDIPVS